MQQFALAPVSPRSVAWLIRSNEWDRYRWLHETHQGVLEKLCLRDFL